MKRFFYVAMMVFGILCILSTVAFKLDVIDMGVCLYSAIVCGLLMFISYALYCIAADYELEHKHKKHVKSEPVTLSEFDFELTNLRREI